MILLTLLVSASGLAQSGHIYIENFEIMPDSTVTVPVILANTDSTRGIQFNLTLPEGLTIADYTTTPYSNSFNMSVSCRSYDFKDYFLVMMYPMRPVCIPPSTEEVILFSFTAAPNFKGGDLLVWKCRGSTIDNHMIRMDGDTTAVSVPASSLIGVPVDQKPLEDQYFNLNGVPMASPDSSSIAIRLTTWSDGRQTAMKMHTAH